MIFIIRYSFLQKINKKLPNKENQSHKKSPFSSFLSYLFAIFATNLTILRWKKRN